jgi:drug/metabolite transporter (DMT)-like permease
VKMLAAGDPLAELFRALANLWSLGLVLAVGATLAWFAYSVCLRRLLRVRRIANIRLQRMLREGESSDQPQ